MPDYLVVATSGRAIAQGLNTLGNSVAVVDGFADCDTLAAASESIKVNRSDTGLDSGETVQAVRDLQSRINFAGLFYDAAIESNPNLLDEININPIFGNSSQTLKACNNPKEFFANLDHYSIPYPEISFASDSVANSTGDWLIKTANSNGGLGIVPVTFQSASNQDGSIDLANGQYLQKKIEGINFSITFLANREDLLMLGFNTQWHTKLGSSMPYAYSGAINHVKLDDDVKQIAHEYAQILVKQFNLVGLNSIDFIYSDNTAYVLEVNPRIPATYDLYETKHGALMEEHIAVCMTNNLPAKARQPLLRAHGLVYAVSDITIDDMSWPLWSSDRPHAGEVIHRYQPVCNVFAGGQNSAQVYEMIERRKQSIISKLTH